jgi:hypothetical protein
MDETFKRDAAVELIEAAARLEKRANGICCCFRSQTPTDDRRALARFVGLLRQRAAVMRKWAHFATEGRPLPLNWRSEMAEALGLAET